MTTEQRVWQDTKRDWTVETKYGPANVVVTDAKHVHFDASGNGKSVVIHGIERRLSAHVHLWSDGHWHVGPEGETEPVRFYNHLYLSRRDKFVSSDGTFRMRITIAEEIERVITAFAAAHPEAFVAGAHVDVNNRIVRIQQELAKAEALVASLRKKFADVEREEAALT